MTRPQHGSAPNRLKEARLAAGIPTAKELAARVPMEPTVYIPLERGQRQPGELERERLPLLLGRPVEWLFPQIADIDTGLADGAVDAVGDVSVFYDLVRGPERLLIRPDEITWSERHPRADRRVDVFLSLSCSSQQAPNLLQDTVAVCDALGVAFVAAAGAAGCCGAAVAMKKETLSQEWARAKARKLARLGVTTNVNWCTACQNRLTREADREVTLEGVRHPMRQVQILSFLEERVRALGDRVPWKREVRRRVAAEGHWFGLDVHRTAQVATTRLLAMVPGVEVVGMYEGSLPGSPCAYRMRSGRHSTTTLPDPPHELAPEPRTVDEVRERRERVADALTAMGADTVSCQHQDCHLLWCYYASDRLEVVHAVSVLAEALGVRHPDRYQAAVRLADPEGVLAQTRPIWSAWHMSELEAREHAYELADPRFAPGQTRCGCGRDRCDEELISVDVLTASITRLKTRGAKTR